MTLSQTELLKWTKLVTEKPESIIALGKDAPYSLVRLALENNLPRYVYPELDQKILDSANYIRRIGILSRKFMSMSTFMNDEITYHHLLVKYSLNGEDKYKDSAKIKFKQASKHTMHYFYSHFSNETTPKYSRETCGKLMNIINFINRHHLMLSDLQLDNAQNKALYVMADIINNIYSYDYEFAQEQLETIKYKYENVFDKLLNIFEGWALTNADLQNYLIATNKNVSSSVWLKGYDVYIDMGYDVDKEPLNKDNDDKNNNNNCYKSHTWLTIITVVGCVTILTMFILALLHM